MVKRLMQWWLMVILLLLPFQLRITQSGFFPSALSGLLQYLDEATIVIFFPLAVVQMYKEKALHGRFFLLLASMIILFTVSGVISGIRNANAPLATALGIFDYIKNFFVIGIYATFFKSSDDLKWVFRALLCIAIALGVVAIFQEIWALVYRYVFGADIHNAAMYPLSIIPLEAWEYADRWRLGICRVFSLVNHFNSLGMYSLFLLTIYLCTSKKIRPVAFVTLLSGVYFSVSRMVYMGFLALGGVQIARGRKWMIAAVIPVITLLILMSCLPEKGKSASLLAAESNALYFRGYTKAKAQEIWKDHFFLGAGPGMFGGVVSIMLQSPVYAHYHFSQRWYDYMKPFRSIDQFWPQLFAETGLLGGVFFAGMLVALALMFLAAYSRAQDHEAKGFFLAFLIALVFVGTLSLGSGFNSTMFIFTYFALAGMALGVYDNTSC